MERHFEMAFGGVAHHSREWERRVLGPGDPLLARVQRAAEIDAERVGRVSVRIDRPTVAIGFRRTLESSNKCTANSAKNKISLVLQQVGPVPGGFAGDHDGQNTWAFELGMDLRYNIFPMVALVGGYQRFGSRKSLRALTR